MSLEPTIIVAGIAAIPGVLSLVVMHRRNVKEQEVGSFSAIVKASSDLYKEFESLYHGVKKDLDSSHQKHRECQDQYDQLAIKHQELKVAFEQHKLECVKTGRDRR